MKYRDRKKLLEEPENVVLIVILCMTLGLILYGETIVKIPRYYSVQVTNADGSKEWVFMMEGTEDEYDAPGELNALWEPPCEAEDDVPPAGDQGAKLEGDLSEPYVPLYEVVNDTAVISEEFVDILQKEVSLETEP